MVVAPNVNADSFVNGTHYIKSDSDEAYELADRYDANISTYYTMTDVVDLTKDYYPVVYKADKADGTIDADSLNNIANDYAGRLGYITKTEVKDGVTTYTISKRYAPNFEYSSLNIAGDNLTWAWAFENGASDDDKKMYNGADTILANLMTKDTLATNNAEVIDLSTMEAPVEANGANVGNYNLNTQFSIKITVEQVD